MKREEGVVAIVMAICLVVLMAAVALTTDVGGLLYRRREMVNGADAAALAAAMECSKGNGLVAAAAAANHQFEGDSPGSKATGYSVDSIAASPACGGTAGHITVRYTTQQPLYFAPVLGLSDHHAVTTEATASWGPAGPFPIAVNLGPPDAFKTCVTSRAQQPWVDSINAAATSAGVAQTPTMLLNGSPVDIATLTPESLKSMIDQRATQ